MDLPEFGLASTSLNKKQVAAVLHKTVQSNTVLRSRAPICAKFNTHSNWFSCLYSQPLIQNWGQSCQPGDFFFNYILHITVMKLL